MYTRDDRKYQRALSLLRRLPSPAVTSRRPPPATVPPPTRRSRLADDALLTEWLSGGLVPRAR